MKHVEFEIAENLFELRLCALSKDLVQMLDSGQIYYIYVWLEDAFSVL